MKEYKNNNSNILMLAYGKNWDLDPLCNYLEKLNIFIENLDKSNKYRSAKFKKDVTNHPLKKRISPKNRDQSIKFVDSSLPSSINN